jgi:hypothetical protein
VRELLWWRRGRGGEGDSVEFDRMPNMSTICRFILTKTSLFHYYAFKLKIPVTQMGYFICVRTAYTRC